MSEKSLFEQLTERRVIRSALVYLALLWVGLQAADLLAGAGMLSENTVRWLIFAGVAGLPVVLLASWFLDSPWKGQRRVELAGDTLIIAAVTVAAALLAWQQWFTSFARPTVAVLHIEATDLRPETDDLAKHLALRLRTALATRPEIRVVEPDSSLHPRLAGLPSTAKAEMLGADLLLSGSVARDEARLRVNLQLNAADGEHLSSDTYEGRLQDLAQLQSRALARLWADLPLPEDGLDELRDAVVECRYPPQTAAILSLAAADGGKLGIELADLIVSHADAGMLYVAEARRLLRRLDDMPPRERPVAHRIALERLASAERLCPSLPDNGLLRFAATRRQVDEEMLRRYPNSAMLKRQAAAEAASGDRAEALIEEARRLDPLGSW